MERRKYRVTIEKVTRESHEIELDGHDIMAVFDEARRLVEQRNKSSHNGKYFVSKIETEENVSK